MSPLCYLLRYLRHGGLPIVNIKNAIYPNNTWVDEEFHYEMNFPSDNEYYELVVEPKQGSTLFGVSLILDDSNRIQQQVRRIPVQPCTPITPDGQ